MKIYLQIGDLPSMIIPLFFIQFQATQSLLVGKVYEFG